MNYKGHRIEVSVWAVDDPKGWMPDISVLYSEHGKSVLIWRRMDQTFATPDRAEKAGIKFAEKWIDDGKLDLNLQPLECYDLGRTKL